MRRLTIFVLVLAALYGGYWFVGRAAVERGGTALLAQIRGEGYDVAYSRLHTIGFPSRFDTTVSDVAISDPGSGIGWRAPFFQVLALSYQPNKVILIAPPRQQIDLPGQTLTLQSDRMRASLSVQPKSALTLNRVTVEVGTADLGSSLGWDTTLDHALFAMRPATAPQAYDLYFDAANLRLPAALLDAMDPGKTLPEPIGDAHIDSTVTFDQPLDRFAGADHAPRPTHILLKEARASWGPIDVVASGELTVDPGGIPEGQITLRAEGWQQLIEALAGAGAIDPGVAPTWIALGERLSQGGTVELPLGFTAGLMTLGPLPIGPAPRF